MSRKQPNPPPPAGFRRPPVTPPPPRPHAANDPNVNLIVLAEATRLAREIHQALKRGERTQDHGLIGNLKCILDHVLPDFDPQL